MKIAALADRLAPALPLLRCPKCFAPLAASGSSLVCEQGHCYDLSAKGYVNLAPARDQSAEKYDARLFESRSAVFADGFYRPVLDAVTSALRARFGGAGFALMDVGCGEGYYARELAAAFPAATVLGVDLSRDAIRAAARAGGAPRWLVADLKRLPVADASLDAVLDVLTPADYAEFARVLKPGGELLKLIPGADYLCEVREAVRDELRADAFSNEQVLRRLRERATVLETVEIRATRPVTEAQSAAFLRMTPMTFHVPEATLGQRGIRTATVHMLLLRCRLSVQ